MNLAKQLYLRGEDVDLMNRNEMAVAGHSHEHWPASKHTATELQADYHACMTALSQLSDRRAFQFGVPFGDVSNGCVSLAKKAGFSDVYISEGFLSPVNGKAFPRVWPHESLDDFATLLSQQFRRQSEALASVKARYLRGISQNGETGAAQSSPSLYFAPSADVCCNVGPQSRRAAAPASSRSPSTTLTGASLPTRCRSCRRVRSQRRFSSSRASSRRGTATRPPAAT